MFEINQELDVTIDRLAYGGDGVAHPNGFTVFVPRSAPGDVWRVKIVDVRRRYARAHPMELKTKSPHRATPLCPHFARCGGCQYQHIEPSFALTQKETHLQDSFQRLGPGPIKAETIFSPERKWNYRNRLTYHRGENGNQGYVAWDTYETLDIEECPIGSQALNKLWTKIRKTISSIPSKMIPYVVLRETSTGQLAALFSVTSKFDAATQDKLKEITASEKQLSVFLTQVREDSRTPFGKEFQCLSGASEITEKVGDVLYTLRPDLFFQVHPEVTEKVSSDVLAWSKNVGNRILDLYCGAGLFGLALAKQGKQVLGVEMNYAAVLSAQKSAELNGLTNAEFRGGKTETVLKKLFQKQERFDAVCVDPPRKGLGTAVIDLITHLRIPHICYISCSPPTLSRDLKELAPKGYEVSSVHPYDMFPQTYHLETVTFLRLKS